MHEIALLLEARDMPASNGAMVPLSQVASIEAVEGPAQISREDTRRRIAVEHGGMRMAWIGRLNKLSGLIEPVAQAGEGTEYLQGIVVSSRADVAEGRGPTGKALRENRPFFIGNFPQDASTSPWHERAFRYGWGASAARSACARTTKASLPPLPRSVSSPSLDQMRSITSGSSVPAKMTWAGPL